MELSSKGLVSRIYSGPQESMRSNGTSRTLAKSNAGSKSGRWATSAGGVASDRSRKPRSGHGENVSYSTSVLVRDGWVSGYNVRKNQYGMFITVKGHDIKVVPFREGCIDRSMGSFIQKGLSVSECMPLKESHMSRDYQDNRRW